MEKYGKKYLTKHDNMSDPGNMEYISGAFFEFMVPFMGIWAITVSVVLAVKHLLTSWKHGKK